MIRASARATTLWLYAISVGIAALVLSFTSASLINTGYERVGFPLIIGSFATTGFLIATKRPGHRIGILYLVSGVLGATWVLIGSYSMAAKLQGWPGYAITASIDSIVYFPWIFSMVVVPMMVFPNGLLPSPRWRWVKWVMASFMVLVAASVFLSPTFGGVVGNAELIDSAAVTEVEGGVVITDEGTTETIRTDTTTTPAGDLLFRYENNWTVTESNPNLVAPDGAFVNPLVIEPLAPPEELVPFLIVLTQGLLVVALAAAPTALIVRFQRSESIERQQLKSLVLPAAVAGVGLILAYSLDAYYGVWWHQGLILVALLGALAIPVATGLAIVRYRLYDIDRLISRTVVYGILVALLAGTYIGVVFLLSQFVPDENSITVAVATLAVAASFNPLRRRIQEFIDRRLYRSRYDAQEIVADFSDRLQDDVEFETIHDELLEVVEGTVKPEAAALWIRGAHD